LSSLPSPSFFSSRTTDAPFNFLLKSDSYWVINLVRDLPFFTDWGHHMKKTLLLTTALTLGASSIAYAGGLAEPVSEPAVIEAETQASSSGGIIIPLVLLLVVAAALASGGGSAPAAAGGSDIRLKEDITRVGTTHLGLPLYQFRYRGMAQVWEGVMAQDVEIMHPNAIKPLAYGYKAVDYAALGLTMRQVH
jgi:hypothetical protein